MIKISALAWFDLKTAKMLPESELVNPTGAPLVKTAVPVKRTTGRPLIVLVLEKKIGAVPATTVFPVPLKSAQDVTDVPFDC
jgi:hypothetical protein